MTQDVLKPLQSRAAGLVRTILAMQLRMSPTRVEVELDMSEVDSNAAEDDQKFGIRVRIDGAEPTPEQSTIIEAVLAQMSQVR